MNTNLKLGIVILSLAALVVCSAVIATIFVPKEIVPHEVVVGDGSISGDGGCTGLISLGKEAMNNPALKNGSTITFMMTSDKETANEPRSLGTYSIPYSERAVERADTITKKKEEILEQVKTRCEQLQPVKASSIFLSLKDAAEQLRHAGCDSKTGCYVYIRTDLQENVEPQIKAAINGDAKALTKLPKPIDNSGITISICGIAVTKGETKEPNGKTRQLTQNRNANKSDLIRQVWNKMFTEPELVKFRPFCSN